MNQNSTKKPGDKLAKLTAKQRRFCDEYLIDLNATQAAIRAGYSLKTARFIANENLTKPNIQSRIQRLMDERSRRTEVTQDKVLQELRKIAFSSIFDYLQIQNNRVKVFDTENIPPDELPAIAEVKQNYSGISLKLHDKLKALELIGKHLGMFKERIEVNDITDNPFKGLTTEELKKLIFDE